jgi:hypothetical protein
MHDRRCSMLDAGRPAEGRVRCSLCDSPQHEGEMGPDRQ